jgi:hypothetical protein
MFEIMRRLLYTNEIKISNVSIIKPVGNINDKLVELKPNPQLS